MKPPIQRVIEVCADWVALGQPTRLGTLTVIPARGKEIFSFACDPAWLRSDQAQVLDPALRLFPGRSILPPIRPISGCFLTPRPTASPM